MCSDRFRFGLKNLCLHLAYHTFAWLELKGDWANLIGIDQWPNPGHQLNSTIWEWGGELLWLHRSCLSDLGFLFPGAQRFVLIELNGIDRKQFYVPVEPAPPLGMQGRSQGSCLRLLREPHNLCQASLSCLEFPLYPAPCRPILGLQAPCSLDFSFHSFPIL